jgi:hypothetical protein
MGGVERFRPCPSVEYFRGGTMFWANACGMPTLESCPNFWFFTLEAACQISKWVGLLAGKDIIGCLKASSRQLLLMQ